MGLPQGDTVKIDLKTKLIPFGLKLKVLRGHL